MESSVFTLKAWTLKYSSHTQTLSQFFNSDTIFYVQ